MQNLKISIVDDHKIFREGLKLLLSTIKNVQVISEAPNGKVFIDNLAEIKPDIVFMDINMKEMDGIEATQKALEIYPDLKIIALTSFEDEEYFNRMTDLGVSGYLMKNSLRDDFEKAINKVIEGSNYYSDELIVKLSRKISQNVKQRKQPLEQLSFSDEEKELLKYICQGLTNKQIGDNMHLSSRTIEAHRARLLDKTSTKNSVSLAVYAISNKLVELNHTI
jgi:NarL family two-component system response regulator LiaR